MKKKFYLALFFTCLIGVYYFSSSNNIKSFAHTDIQVETIVDTVPFTLKKGDILVRPNWEWLPGSYHLNTGRMFGHAAIVIENVSGKTVDEALAKASVIEAVIFDQATRTFQFNKKDQVREIKAAVSFGNRFKGIRYRLRMNMTVDQVDAIILFLKNQLDGGYSVFSFRNSILSANSNYKALEKTKNVTWHCASLAWGAYYLNAGLDIDANRGWVIYPADIIASKYFDSPGGRIRF